jgi:hypothetical protein
LLSCRKKLDEVNKKLGEKFEISETELLSTVDACKALMAEGQDIDTGAASTQVRHLGLKWGSGIQKNGALSLAWGERLGLGWEGQDMNTGAASIQALAWHGRT